MLHSLADFAQVCHVSKPAITQAVKRGLIIRGTDGKIDDTDPVNALYLGGKTGAVKKVAPLGGAGRAPKKVKASAADQKAAAEFTAMVIKTQAKRDRKKDNSAESDRGEDTPDPESGDDEIRAFMEAFLKEGGQAVLLIKKLS